MPVVLTLYPLMRVFTRKQLRMSGLLLYLCCLALLQPNSAQAETSVMHPFRSDGCSLFPDRALIGEADWCRCCLLHDLAYWQGGTEQQRLRADQDLKSCVLQQSQQPELAELMFTGVRLGGAAYSIMPYRWGYGRQYGRFNQPLSAAEQQQASQLKQHYLQSNPTLSCPTP